MKLLLCNNPFRHASLTHWVQKINCFFFRSGFSKIEGVSISIIMGEHHYNFWCNRYKKDLELFDSVVVLKDSDIRVFDTVLYATYLWFENNYKETQCNAISQQIKAQLPVGYAPDLIISFFHS